MLKEYDEELGPILLRYWVLRYIHDENVKGIIGIVIGMGMGIWEAGPYRYFRFINTKTTQETLVNWSSVIQDYAKEISIDQAESYIAMDCMPVFKTFPKREKDRSLSLVVIIDG